MTITEKIEDSYRRARILFNERIVDPMNASIDGFFAEVCLDMNPFEGVRRYNKIRENQREERHEQYRDELRQAGVMDSLRLLEEGMTDSDVHRRALQECVGKGFKQHMVEETDRINAIAYVKPELSFAELLGFADTLDHDMLMDNHTCHYKGTQADYEHMLTKGLTKGPYDLPPKGPGGISAA